MNELNGYFSMYLLVYDFVVDSRKFSSTRQSFST